MLTAHAAFPAQDPQRHRVTKADPPIDHAHLSRYTMNDHELECEILALFLETLAQTTVKLNTACDPKQWAMAAHTLKGSARAVGAWNLAKLMETAERPNVFDANPDTDPDQSRRDILTDLDTAARLTKTYIDALIATSASR